ncbi:AtpZ/AtpI family protein [Roseibium algae]|uniref:ATP synthase protein I n=1 Tax=Roseibium algae TaxID=3123038 RepID=A0ABU8TH59_9HYPH
MNDSAQNGENSDRKKEQPEAGLSDRRDQLNRMLDDRRKAEQVAATKSNSSTSGYGQAMKLSSEFIAGIVVGCGIGWLLDQWLGTTPFGLIVFLLLGFVAGVLNVLRSAGYVAEPENKIRSDKPNEDGSE